MRPGRATLLYIDFTLYKSLNGFAYHHDGFEDALRFFALYAQWAFLMVLAVLFLVRGKWRSVNGRHGVVAAGFSALLALGVAQLLADWVSRPRPYVAHAADAHLFIARSADPSFPSDHATAAFAIAVALLLRHRKAGMLALGLAMLVSLGRVAVGHPLPDRCVGRRGDRHRRCAGDLASVFAGAAASPCRMGGVALRAVDGKTVRSQPRTPLAGRVRFQGACGLPLPLGCCQ